MYVLEAHDKVDVRGLKSESTLYYPGVRDRRQAVLVSVEAIGYSEGLKFVLPSIEQRRTVAGRVQFSDGRCARSRNAGDLHFDGRRLQGDLHHATGWVL
jgi:hypothetical protein